MLYKAIRNQKNVFIDLIMPGWHRIKFFQVANSCFYGVNIEIYRTILTTTAIMLFSFKMSILDTPRSPSNGYNITLRAYIVQSLNIIFQ
jgi:hypothetical protein